MDIKKEQIKDLIRCNLVIPENQRGYDWKEMHADDFWQDIFEIEEENNQQDFYLGSILLLNRNEGVYEVVDGQQRITTIYIFLIALRQFAKMYGFSRIDYGVTEYLNSKHYSFKPSPTIQKALSVIIDTKWDGEFNDVVKKQARQKKATRICYQNRRIKPVYNFFRKELHQAVNTFQTENDQFGQEERLDQLEDYLLSTLDKVEKILVTRIEIKEVEEAFMLFERLNARGASLSVADLFFP